MQELLEPQLQALKREFEMGKEQLQQLQKQSSELEKTLLRISGAIQALEELKAASADNNQATSES